MKNMVDVIKDLIKDCNLDLNKDQEKIISALSQKIEELLSENPQKLIQALYLLDVSEVKVTKALKSPNFSHELAKLIIERETEKYQSRLKN